MIQQKGLVDGAGVVVQPSGDGQVNDEVFFRHSESRQIGSDDLQFAEAGIKSLVPSCVIFQRGKNLRIRPLDGDEGENVVRLLLRQAAVLQQNDLYLVNADLVQLVHGAHDVAGLLRQTHHGVEAVENLPVVDMNLEPGQAEALEYLIDDGGDFRLVENVQLAVANDIDVRLIEFPEPAALRPLAPVDLADLVAAEGESQLVIVQGNVFCQRHRQVEAQSKVAVALGEAVDLFFRLSAALGKQNLGILDHRGVQRCEAVGGVGLAQNLRHAVKFQLLFRQQLHKAGQCPGLDDLHSNPLQ